MKPKVTTEHKRGNAKIFKNPILESLTKTNVATSIIVYGITVASLIYYSLFIIETPLKSFLILFGVAFFFWTFVEYVLHRFVFHFINKSKAVKRFHFIMHGAHHLFPKDKDRLLMPPVPGLIMANILFGVFYSIFYLTGFPKYSWSFFSGFFLGYLLYSFLHRATHTMRPPKRFYFIWRHHSLHHYKYPDKAFGVSSPFWDYIFGTMPPKLKK